MLQASLCTSTEATRWTALIATRAVEAAGQCFQELFGERSCLPMPALRRVGQPHGNSPDREPKWALPPPLKPSFDVPGDSGQGGLVHAVFPPRRSLFAASVFSDCIRFVEAERSRGPLGETAVNLTILTQGPARAPACDTTTGGTNSLEQLATLAARQDSVTPGAGTRSLWSGRPAGAQSPFLTADLLWRGRKSTAETPGATSHGAFHG